MVLHGRQGENIIFILLVMAFFLAHPLPVHAVANESMIPVALYRTSSLAVADLSVAEQVSGTTKSLPTIGGTREKVDVENEDMQDEPSRQRFPTMIIRGISLLLVITAIVTLIALKKRRRNKVVKQPEQKTLPEPVPAPPQSSTNDSDTQKSNYIQHISGETWGMWTPVQDNIPRQAYLVLRNLYNPAVIFEVAINDVIHIGRYMTDIVIDDPYVSGKHCDVILKEGILYLRDVGSLNGTTYEEMKISEERPIASGGRICIGMSQFSLKLIWKKKE